MPNLDRRSLLFAGAALPATLISTPTLRAAIPEGSLRPWADSVVLGATVLTMDDAQPVAEAIAIRGDRILAVGSTEAVREFIGPDTLEIDASGKTVTPGFIDSHSHPLGAREAVGVNVGFRSIVEVQQALADKAAKSPPGVWIIGVMYDDTKFIEGRPLTRRDIDEAVPDKPVFVRHRGGHTAVVNSAGFAVAGITAATPDPEGGKFYRENGELTGKVAEHAMDPLREAGRWPVVTRALMQESVRLTSARMASKGLTSTTDAYGTREAWIAYQDANAAGEMHFRLSFMPGARARGAGSQEIYTGLKAAGVRSGFGDEMLRLGAVKYAADGSASERTMSMSTPYEGRPDDFGILTMSQDEIDEAVDDAFEHDFRIGIHANGDVAIDRVLRAYERVLKDHKGPNPRFRIEHCSLVNDELLRRIKAIGVVPTPFYTYAYYHGNKWVEYGPEKMEAMFAHRSFLDWGIPVAPASDFTPGPYEPMMALQSMVTRKDMQGRVWGGSQRISVDQALKICTMHGAYASFEENLKGSLTPGKLADYVILGEDPRSADPDRIIDIPILRTVLGGRDTHVA
ncbi:MAG: amidohydrolase [Halieaceae bacterium]|jgi:predicted amidohydrolase YtcJ|nr:amidohydrolase [Halieaceae bacterium]